MPDHAAFLRGVNLGRHRRVSGEELRSSFGELDFTDVATFRASGNVVFTASGEPPAELKERIERGLATSLGHEIVVFLRTAQELCAIARHEPFAGGMIERSGGKLQVAILPAPPDAGTRAQALALATTEDKLALRGSELYWLPSGRMLDSTLDLAALERLVGPWTMRTMGTIEQLATKYFG